MKVSSARSQIRIQEVKDGVLVLPGSKYRMILEVSSINFELKSEEEQDALIESYQHFLNSLPCPVQILVRIREVDIEGYLETFMEKNRGEKNKIYRSQIKNYRSFIKKLVSGNKIMSRKFYLIIPYKPSDHNVDFSVVCGQLKLNADIIGKGLEKLGMKTRVLGNIEILEMFYSIYNPSVTKIQPLNKNSFEALFNNNYAI